MARDLAKAGKKRPERIRALFSSSLSPPGGDDSMADRTTAAVPVLKVSHPGKKSNQENASRLCSLRDCPSRLRPSCGWGDESDRATGTGWRPDPRRAAA